MDIEEDESSNFTKVGILKAQFLVDFEMDKSGLKKVEKLVQENLQFKQVEAIFDDNDASENLDLSIIEKRIEGQFLNIILEGQYWGLQLFLDGLIDEGFEVMTEEFIVENLFTPHFHYRHFLELYANMNLEEQDFPNMDDANKYLEHFKGVPLNDLPVPNALNRLAVEAFSLKAYDLERRESLQLLDELANDYPDGVEIKICQAGWQYDTEVRIDLLQDALDAGLRYIDVDLMNREKMWWMHNSTRPYMRAQELLAHELDEAGYRDDAIEIFEDLLKLNPSDNQGVRIELMEKYIVDRNLVAANKLLKDFSNDGSLIFYYGRYLYYYLKYGEKAKTRQHLIKAMERNIYPFICMITNDLPDQVDYIKPGEPSEAMEVMPMLAQVFNSHKKLALWTMQEAIKTGMLDEFMDEMGEEL